MKLKLGKHPIPRRVPWPKLGVWPGPVRGMGAWFHIHNFRFIRLNYRKT
ncbi:MAG: hypothetical protein V7643_1640 [Mycobacterium sp.]